MCLKETSLASVAQQETLAQQQETDIINNNYVIIQNNYAICAIYINKINEAIDLLEQIIATNTLSY